MKQRVFEIGDRVLHKASGVECAVAQVIGGPVPTFALRFLNPAERPNWPRKAARADELEPLEPLPEIEVGASVVLTGMRLVVVELLADGRYRCRGSYVKAGVTWERFHDVPRWLLTPV